MSDADPELVPYLRGLIEALRAEVFKLREEKTGERRLRIEAEAALAQVEAERDAMRAVVEAACELTEPMIPSSRTWDAMDRAVNAYRSTRLPPEGR